MTVTLRELVVAKYGTMAAWGREIGVSAYKARQWANDQDGTVTDEDDHRIARSLGMSDTDFFQRFRTNRYYVGRHVFTLTSRQLCVLMNIASDVGAKGVIGSQLDLKTERLVARAAGEYVHSGEDWLQDDEMLDFLKWWSFMLDMC